MLKNILLLIACVMVAGCGANKQLVRNDQEPSSGSGYTSPDIYTSSEKEVLVSVEAESLIAPIKDNLLATKEQGLEAAKRNAIEKAIGVFVTGQMIVQQAALIDEKIFSKVGGYIKEFNVISQDYEGDLFKTKITAKVKQADIRKQINDLGLLIQTNTVNNPRVVVLIDEVVDGTLANKQTATTIINGALINAEYKVVDIDQLEKIQKQDQMVAALNGDEKAAALIGVKFDADVSVLGQVNTTTKNNTDGVMAGTISSNSILNVKVLKSTTGEMLYAHDFKSRSWDITTEAATNKTTSDCAALAAKDLVGIIAKKLYENVTINIQIGNVTDLNKLEDFRKAVRYLDGVSDAKTRDFVGDIATVELTMKYGNAQLIAAKLEKLKEMKVKVTQVGGHAISCEIQD